MVGNLFLPEGDEPAGVVVAVGPLTSVKEQAAGAYARAMAERGYAALAFDYRYFGESGGRGSSRTPKPISRTSRTRPPRCSPTTG